MAASCHPAMFLTLGWYHVTDPPNTKYNLPNNKYSTVCFVTRQFLLQIYFVKASTCAGGQKKTNKRYGLLLQDIPTILKFSFHLPAMMYVSILHFLLTNSISFWVDSFSYLLHSEPPLSPPLSLAESNNQCDETKGRNIQTLW